MLLSRIAHVTFFIMSIDGHSLNHALEVLGEVLQARGLAYDIVVVGGSGLLLLGYVTRPTKDLDALALVEDGSYVSADPLPPPLAAAITSVGRALDLSADWLNPGPTELLRYGLPDGFDERVDTRRYGELTLHIAGRFDQVCFKLYATVDQGMNSKHAADLRALRPRAEELLAAGQWSRTHDPSEGYRLQLVETLVAFGVADADDYV